MKTKFDSVDILGVRVDAVTMAQVTEKVMEWVQTGGKHYIVTPNVEFIIAAQKDEQFRKVLNNADLAIPDSARLGWTKRMLTEKNFFKKLLLWPLFLSRSQVVTGTDLMDRLCQVSAEKGLTVGFLGGKDGVAVKVAECLKKKYPKLKISYTSPGGAIDKNGNPQQVVSKYYPATDLLFVAFGQVKQEKWIAQNLSKIPVKVAMGVGGAFDYLSGSIPRAPGWIRSLGLEWLFRLIIQPWRIKRFGALVKFVWLVLIKE